MLEIDSSQVKGLERDLWLLSTRAGPYANTSALNGLAFLGQYNARQIIQSEFVNRNRWTARSVQVDRARVGDIGKSYSTLGSTMPYMERQEFGGTRTKQGRYGVPIPTKAAAEVPGGTAVGPRKGMVRKANRLQVLKLGRVGRTANRKQLNAALVGAARGKGQIVFLDLGRRKGLFRVVGSKAKPQIRMLYDLSHASVNDPKHPWLWPASKFASLQGPSLYVAALEDQIKRQQLFKSRRR